MEREFVFTNEFLKRWQAIGLSEEDLRELEIFLCSNPMSGDVIVGTGGVRKLRWQIKGQGKSSGSRVLYIDFTSFERIYMLTAYTKNEKSDLTMEQRKILYSLVKKLEVGKE
ncbi:type II toxin-antitoxin system RelE/ParE family toxin [Herbivorax sp. ANBcel31]|uniref:type II toxin-antitoxin system RelE/ParE family toxin n=1 Tax=Herbivorax sp. ANBcel31 TaxID=3069754 RepID=UPI0027B75AFA|nr:type II toxin-antitoxin system RelE/ParE family toxin [Herbivorax sp. ANBcel31]MDQ2087255.1 type II toxin-antitoxin system RelE/ParE family toxin [Herbivorax sp. ANBcel31]